MTIAEATQLAYERRRAGELAETEAICRQILAAQPGHAPAFHILGTIAHAVGQHGIAVDLFQQAIRLNPSVADYHTDLSAALGTLGEFEAAIGACREAIRLQPEGAQAYFNLGKAEEDLRHWEEAAVAFRQAVTLRPDFAEACDSLGNALSELGRVAEAIEAFRMAVQIRPDFAAAHNNLGNALSRHGLGDAAIDALRTALRLEPGYAVASTNLASALKDQGRMDEAMDFFRHASALDPENAHLHSNLVYAALFHHGTSVRELREMQAAWDERHAAPLRAEIAPHPNDRDPERRLKIGYVSPDFCGHVITHFLAPLLEAHDRARFEVHCYSSVRRPDALTERLRKCASVWRDVLDLPDDALAEQIRQDGIDILVDLTQHMAEHRLLVFARKPAPVQVAWLGYPGSTGLRTMDYRITDAHMEPEGAEWSQSVEKPIRLPDSWFCFDPIDDFSKPGDLPAARAGHVTFCCLNNFCKVNDAVLHLWAKVLSAVKDSHLVLRCPQGSASARVREFFAARGIDPARLELVSWFASRREFLELFQRIDLALDPFPYNGGTTTCEALWMGVPVLTFPGEHIVARIGLSILSAVGVPEFCAASQADFVDLVAKVAGDLPRLAGYRATLRSRMKASPFMDGPRFARDFERACEGMWRAWCAS